jgi:hypothetical protein
MTELAVTEYLVILNDRRLSIYVLPDKEHPIIADNIEELDWSEWCDAPHCEGHCDPADYVKAYLKERFTNIKWAPSTICFSELCRHYRFEFTGDRK